MHIFRNIQESPYFWRTLYIYHFYINAYPSCKLNTCLLFKITRSSKYWKPESATKWLSILWRSRNNDSPRHKCIACWAKKRRNPWWLHRNRYQDLYTNFKNQWRKLKRKRKRRKSIPAIYRWFSFSLSLSFSLSRTLPFCLSFYQPLSKRFVRSISVLNIIGVGSKKRKREKKERRGERGSRKIYQNYFCVEEEM